MDKPVKIRPRAITPEWAGQKASLLPLLTVSRRGFVAAGIGSGFALAVLPVMAAAIKTDSEGLVAGEVKIPVADGEIPGYRAMPTAGGPFAAVLVIHEIFGVHEHIQDLCRRLAKRGYFAVAPAIYARHGDVTKMSSVGEIVDNVVSKVPDAQVTADLDATAAWAQKTGDADTARLGVTGFCWGGRQVWLYAERNPRVKAGVAWYGQLRGTQTKLRPEWPLDVALRLKVPVLGLYGGKDSGIPLSDVDAMRAALRKGKSGSEIRLYPDAPHGFNADYRPSYRAEDAKDAWGRMLAWFKDHGVA